MTLTPIMILTLVVGIPLFIYAYVDMMIPDPEEDLDSSDYVTISMHPITLIAMSVGIAGVFAYITWLLTDSLVLTVGMLIAIEFLVPYLYAEFFGKHHDETENEKGESEDQRQDQPHPAPTLLTHPSGVTTSHPRHTHRPRVASAAKGR